MDRDQGKTSPRKARKAAPAQARDPQRSASRASTGKQSIVPMPTAAVVVVAHNQARRIAATVRASLAIPGVDLVVVMDDGSTDNTGDLARKAGAVVVRQSHQRGRVPSLETAAAVVAMRDVEGAPARALLLMEANMGSAAIGAAPLVSAVLEQVADLAIGLSDDGVKHQGAAPGAARRAIAAVSGWSPVQPLSKVRCLTREAFEASVPFARGAGLEAAMTLDVIDAGLTVTEIACEMRHRSSRPSPSLITRANQYRDVMIAISSRKVKISLRSTQHVVEDVFHVASAQDSPK